MKLSLFLFLLSAAFVSAAAPWPGVQYAEVRAFAWDASVSPEELIRADMSFADGVINKDGTRLSDAQVKRLLRAEAHPLAVPRTPGCYNPHNAFVFYNARKKPVAFLEICFDCTISRTYPEDPDGDPDLVALAISARNSNSHLAGARRSRNSERRLHGYTPATSCRQNPNEIAAPRGAPAT